MIFLEKKFGSFKGKQNTVFQFFLRRPLSSLLEVVSDLTPPNLQEQSPIPASLVVISKS